MTIQLGFKNKREEKKKVEALFPFPYLIMEAKPSNKGGTHKFRLEGKSVRGMFNFTPRDNKISYGQLEDSHVDFFIINTSSITHDKEIKVNLDLSFNSKLLFNRLEEQLNLDTSVDIYFELDLLPEGYKDFPTVMLKNIIEGELIIKKDDIIDETELKYMEDSETLIENDGTNY